MWKFAKESIIGMALLGTKEVKYQAILLKDLKTGDKEKCLNEIFIDSYLRNNLGNDERMKLQQFLF